MHPKHLISTFLLFISFTTFAQVSEKDWKKHQSKIEKSKSGNKVEISYDTLFHNGLAYCIFDEGERMLGNILNFTIKDLQGTEVIWGKMVTGQEIGRPDVVTAYDLTFVQSSQKAMFVNVIGNSLARDLVKYQLFENGGYNSSSEMKFINFHPHYTATHSGYPIQTPSGQSTMVSRNRSAPIQIFGNEIKQDFKLIGYIQETRQIIGGKTIIQLSVTTPNGTLVASGQNEDVFSHEWILITAKDNKSHTLTSSLGKDKEDMVSYLVRLLYL